MYVPLDCIIFYYIRNSYPFIIYKEQKRSVNKIIFFKRNPMETLRKKKKNFKNKIQLADDEEKCNKINHASVWFL